MNYWSGTQCHKLNRIRVTRLKTFPFLLILFYDSVTYDPVKTRLLELEAEVEEPTNYKAQNQILWLIYSSASASTLTMEMFLLDLKWLSQKQNGCSAFDSINLIFTGSALYSTLPTTTPALTLSPVKKPALRKLCIQSSKKQICQAFP